MKPQLEICCFNIQSALIAQKAGASRVELCADPTGGGTTPSHGFIKEARKNLHIALYPIIRPRGGDFLFSQEEFQIMLEDIAYCKQVNCDGVVIGMLNKDGAVDKKRSAKLVEVAYPMGVTFHRAFDWASNPFESLEDLIDIGCERVLSSGQKPTALEGAGLILELIRMAEERIVVMPGSGVRASNIRELMEATQATEFHTSARMQKETEMSYINQEMGEDISLTLANQSEIELIIQRLHQPIE